MSVVDQLLRQVSHLFDFGSHSQDASVHVIAPVKCESLHLLVTIETPVDEHGDVRGVEVSLLPLFFTRLIAGVWVSGHHFLNHVFELPVLPDDIGLVLPSEPVPLVLALLCQKFTWQLSFLHESHPAAAL